MTKNIFFFKIEFNLGRMNWNLLYTIKWNRKKRKNGLERKFWKFRCENTGKRYNVDLYEVTSKLNQNQIEIKQKKNQCTFEIHFCLKKIRGKGGNLEKSVLCNFEFFFFSPFRN